MLSEVHVVFLLKTEIMKTSSKSYFFETLPKPTLPVIPVIQ